MYKLVSRNKLFALILVLVLLFGVYRLVGTAEEEGAIAAATDEIEARAREARQVPTQVNDPQNEPGPEFIEDDELIDSAEGDDPSGFDASGFDAEGFDASGDDAGPMTDPAPVLDLGAD